MQENTLQRVCVACGVDISDRHANCMRCVPCQGKYRKARYLHQCAHCDVEFRTNSLQPQRFCSYRCRGNGLDKNVNERTCVVCGAQFLSWVADVCSAACQQWRWRNPGARVGRTCRYCGSAIAAKKQFGSMYCGLACQGKARNHLRRQRIESKPIETFSPVEIFQRDQWTCHLCNKSISPSARGNMSPSLDHLIPVSHPRFPGHIRTNVAASHWRCNHRKRASLSDHDILLVRYLVCQVGVRAAQARIAADFQSLKDQLASDSTDQAAVDAAVARLDASIAMLDSVDPDPENPPVV